MQRTRRSRAPVERLAALEWYQAVTRYGKAPCAVCGRTAREPGVTIQAHHVITQQQLRLKGLADWAWDRRNGMAVCENPCHAQHTTAFKRISYGCLSADNIAFVEEHGLENALERQYPREEL